MFLKVLSFTLKPIQSHFIPLFLAQTSLSSRHLLRF